MSDNTASKPSESEIRKRFDMGQRMSKGKLGNRTSKMHGSFYRLTGGRAGTRVNDVLGDRPVLLLTSRGQRSGKERTVPLIYLADEDSWIVVASNSGQATDPAWLHNLQAQPQAEIQIGKDHIPVTADVLSEQAASEVWPRLNAMYRGYEFYQELTDRTLRVVRLRRRG